VSSSTATGVTSEIEPELHDGMRIARSSLRNETVTRYLPVVTLPPAAWLCLELALDSKPHEWASGRPEIVSHDLSRLLRSIQPVEAIRIKLHRLLVRDERFLWLAQLQ
jgi:hypothetical protein